MSERPIWTPSPESVARANMTRFMALANQRFDAGAADYDSLWRWSIESPEAFWTAVWDFCGIRAETRGERVLVDGDRMPGARFFPDARLGFSENLLAGSGDAPALVSRIRQALEEADVRPGDRVAGFVPNLPETVAAMLAAASLGATRLATLRHVVLPLVKTGVIAGAVFAFIHSFTDVNLSVFLARPGEVPITVKILGFLEFGFAPTLAAVAVITLLLPLVLVTIVERVSGLGDFIYGERK